MSHDFDLTDLDNFAGGFPHDAFTRWRSEDPVHWHAPTPTTPQGEGFWVVSRMAEVLEVFHDAQTYSSERGGAREHGGTWIQDLPFAGVMLNMMDDPRHRRIRSLVNRGFVPRVVAALEGDLRRRARSIVEPVVAAGSGDFVVDVARELPLQAICMLLGIPQEDRSDLCEWVDMALEFSGRELGEQTDETRASSARLAAYGADLIARKRRDPTDDMLSLVVHATLQDDTPPQMSEGELMAFFHLLFTAGSETTRKSIAGGLLAFLESPDQEAKLRANPGLMPTAVEEIVRFTTPSVYKRRTVTRPVRLAGQALEPGDKVTVWEMSANRDADTFDDPFRFDVARDPNPHVGFGHGLHYCLGANLARLEIRVLLEEWFAQVASCEPAGDVAWTRDNRLFGLKHLPIRVKGA